MVYIPISQKITCVILCLLTGDMLTGAIPV